MGNRARGASVSPSDRIINDLPCYHVSVKQRIKMDVSNLMFSVVTLRPERGELVSNDGNVSTLLKLTGTVPIFYKGSQYNIPMDVWVNRGYPDTPPTLYVTPTQGMAIKPGHAHVDTSGQVYLPYLNQWNASVSNLAEVVAHCAKSFGYDPPVYAKPKGGASQPAARAAVSSYANNATTYPATSPPAYGSAVGGGSASSTLPRLPSYGSAVNSSKTPPPAYGNVNNPPLPPRDDPFLRVEDFYPAPNPSGGGGHVGAIGATSTSTPYPRGASNNSTPYPMGNRSATNPNANSVSKKDTLKKALNIKLQKKLNTFYQDIRVKIDAEFETQDKLERGQELFDQAEPAIAAKKRAVQKNVNDICEQNDALEDWLETQEANGENLNIDDVIAPSDAISEQLCECVAKVSTIEDMLYHLEQALNDGSIELKACLRIVRRVSRDMFMNKALGLKITKALQESSNNGVQKR